MGLAVSLALACICMAGMCTFAELLHCWHCRVLQDVMFAFDRSKLKSWVDDIKQLIKKDLRGIPGWGAHTRCAGWNTSSS